MAVGWAAGCRRGHGADHLRKREAVVAIMMQLLLDKLIRRPRRDC